MGVANTGDIRVTLIWLGVRTGGVVAAQESTYLVYEIFRIETKKLGHLGGIVDWATDSLF